MFINDKSIVKQTKRNSEMGERKHLKLIRISIMLTTTTTTTR